MRVPPDPPPILAAIPDLKQVPANPQVFDPEVGSTEDQAFVPESKVAALTTQFEPTCTSQQECSPSFDLSFPPPPSQPEIGLKMHILYSYDSLRWTCVAF